MNHLEGIPKRIVFVVGAGASCEVGFPTGDQLRRSIVDKLKPIKNHLVEDKLISAAIGWLSGLEGPSESYARLQGYLKATNAIYNGLPWESSIDQFIHKHRDDKLITECGKLAIATSILDFEVLKKGNFEMNLHAANGVVNLDSENVSLSWFAKLFKLLFSGRTWEECPSVLQKVAVVTFNYDRCIEHALFVGLKGVFKGRRSDEEIAGLLKHLEIYHPYGSVGKLSWMQGDAQIIEFGAKEMGHDHILEAAKCLRTFTEGTNQEETEILRIRSIMHTAYTTVFLGFGYLDLNLDLLYGNVRADSKDRLNGEVYGTAYFASPTNVERFKQKIRRRSGFLLSSIVIRSELTASGLLGDYSESISVT